MCHIAYCSVRLYEWGFTRGIPLCRLLRADMQFYLKRSFIYRPLEQEGSETRSEGFPTALSPISVRTEIGCPRGTSAKRLYFLKKGKRIAAVASLLRNDEEWEKRIAAHLTAFAMTKETDLGALKRAAENGSPDL